MEIKITPIIKLQFEKVHFYSVRMGDKPNSEFKDFALRMAINEKNKKEFGALIGFLTEIGKIYGAIDRKFKKEDLAERVRKPLFIDFEDDNRDPNDYGLRLYCYRVNEQVVILFNGDRKTVSDDVKLCKNCKDHFFIANTVSDILIQAFNSGKLYLSDTFKINSKVGFTLKL